MTLQTNVLKQSKVLIVDDEKANIRFLEIVLQEAEYSHVYSTTDAREALELCRRIQPDLVLLDLSMPHLDGFAVIKCGRGGTGRDGRAASRDHLRTLQPDYAPAKQTRCAFTLALMWRWPRRAA